MQKKFQAYLTLAQQAAKQHTSIHVLYSSKKMRYLSKPSLKYFGTFFHAKYDCTVPESPHTEGYINVIRIRAISENSIFLKIQFRQKLNWAYNPSSFEGLTQLTYTIYIKVLLQAVQDFRMLFNIPPLKLNKTHPDAIWPVYNCWMPGKSEQQCYEIVDSV